MFSKLFSISRTLEIYVAHYRRVFQIFDGFNRPSYCSKNEKVKSRITQILDYLYLFFVLKILPSNYHLFRFDAKSRKQFKEYLGDPWSDPFMKKFRILFANGILVHDKYIFKCLCTYHGLPAPRLYGIYQNGSINGTKTGLRDLMIKNNLENIVLKPKAGLGGLGIQFVTRNDLEELESLSNSFKGEYIVEEAIKQHPEMDKINPHSVNSVRVVTLLCSDGKVEFLAVMLKTSSSTSPVDNFNLGGIAIGIDLETGGLKKEGFVKFVLADNVIKTKNIIQENDIEGLARRIKEIEKSHPGNIMEKHPVTNTEFFGFQIPFWNELKEIAIKAQKEFYPIKSVAWDIAIGIKGPVILEGNQMYGTAAIQATNGGMLIPKNRKLFSQYGLRFH